MKSNTFSTGSFTCRHCARENVDIHKKDGITWYNCRFCDYQWSARPARAKKYFVGFIIVFFIIALFAVSRGTAMLHMLRK